jgi:hypothetical protein
MNRKREARVINTCYEVVPKLAQLEVTKRDDSHLMDDASMEKVLGILGDLPKDIARDVFWMLDEKPGTFGYDWDGQEWHYKLRQLRNHQTFGKRMFAAFTGE